MRYSLVLLILFSIFASAEEIPPASKEFRQSYIADNVPFCIKTLEEMPDERALHSHKTIVAYCSCRQRYKADVISWAIDNNQRGKEVSDRADAYTNEKCLNILIEDLEEE